MSKTLPVKALFFIGLLLGAGIVAAVTFAPGDAGTVSDGAPYGAPDGMNATIDGTTDLVQESDVLYPQSDTVQFKTESGNITFQSAGPAYATVHKDNITGAYTNVTAIDATQNDITINPETKQSVTVGGQIDHIAWRDAGAVGVDDGTVDFVYGGPTGTSKVAIGGVATNTQIGAVDAQTAEFLDIATSDGSGQVTFSSLSNSDHAVTLQTSSGGPTLDDNSMSPTADNLRFADQTLSIDLSDPDLPSDNVTLEWYVDGTKRNTTFATSAGTVSAQVGPLSDGSHDWRVVATDAYGQSDTSATKSFEIDHYDPDVTNVGPSGKQSSPPTQVSAQVNDTDFAFDGDTLTVEVSLDGSVIDTQTINSNQTVTTSLPDSGKTGGSHDVSVSAADSYGQSDTTTSSYQVPGTFFIRAERNHSQLVAADGSVRFFGEDQVFERKAPDGTVNMTGLPVGQDFIADITPTDDNYTSRTIYIESIYEQQSAYVLNTSAVQTVENRFVLEDPTGKYDSQTLLKVKKAVNVSGTAKFQTIASDEFGVEGVTATLEEGQRYRLVVSDGGEEQVVGPYRADVSETVSVEPGSPVIIQEAGAAAYTDGWFKNATLRNDTLEYAYSDLRGETDKLVINIHKRGDPSALLTANQTFIDIGNASGIVKLSANQTDDEWVVNYVVSRNGETYVLTDILGNQKNLAPPVDSGWQLVMGISMLILFAGAFSILNARIGAVVVSLVGGVLWYIGFLGAATTGIAVVSAIFLSVLGYYLRS